MYVHINRVFNINFHSCTLHLSTYCPSASLFKIDNLFIDYNNNLFKIQEERVQGAMEECECKEGEHGGESVEESARRAVQGERVQRGERAPGRSEHSRIEEGSV